MTYELVLTPADRRALTSIRESLAFFGHDVSDQPDETLAETLVAMGSALARVGVTTMEIAESLAMVSRMLGAQENG